MITLRSSRWVFAAAAALLLAGSAAAAQDNEDRPLEKVEKVEKVEKKIVIVDGDGVGDHRGALLRMLGDEDLECHQENGKKVCVATVGAGHHLFAGTFLGVELTETTPELREHLGAPREAGVLIARIEEASPATQAGLAVGDIVTAVDGDAIESARDLRRAISSKEPGQAVTIELYRDGRLEQMSATLGKREPRDFTKRITVPHPMLNGEAIADQVREALAGIDFEELDASVRQRLEEVDWEAIREAVRKALDRALEEQEK